MPSQAKRRCGRCKAICSGHCTCMDRERGTSAERGYGYRWRQTREAFLTAHPFCNDCGRVEKDMHVHHKIKVRDNQELLHDHNNLMTLCQRCHSIRTKRGE